MAAVKKKIAKKRNSQLAAEIKFAEYAQEMKFRGAWARKILKAQDQKTQDAVNEMIEAISTMADSSRTATVNVNGDSIIFDVPDEVFENGWVWVAVRLCMSAYEWGICVANFKPIRKRKAI